MLKLGYIFMLVHCVAVGSTDYNTGGVDLSHLGISVYGKPNVETGIRVARWTETLGINPEELGQYIEGDILFPANLAKNGLIAETSRWPDGIVPYDVDGFFLKKERDMIDRAMEEYHKNTCIRFRRRAHDDDDWISIVSGNTGCWSSVGRIGGKQEVNFQTPNCFAKIGTVIHELLHVLGFQHEQNRWERDSYVTIHWDNIVKGRENNFIKATRDTVTGFGIPYDYNSVMHYSEKAFSKNGDFTVTVQNSGAKIGQREGFSEKDIEKVNLMYNCLNRNSSDISENIKPDREQNKGPLENLISLIFP